VEVADLYVVLRGVGADFNKSMAEAGAAAEGADTKIGAMMATTAKLALGTAAVAIGVGVAAVKMAASYDAAMNRIHTLAGVSSSVMPTLSKGVLDLAGQVGFSPDSLAEALYHVESSFQSVGITAQGALDITRIAAEGAKIGNANLVDVTNALDAAIASGIPGVQDYKQAMGELLTIVGSGDMTMQNLADALGTGVLAIAKQYGATLDDVGAALATFGDNNIRGSEAATYLRMSIMDLTKQSKVGAAALLKIGITSGELGKDMQTGGLNKALLDLKSHLDKAHITGTQVGMVLEEAFTKKSSAPLAVLLGEMDRFESKYPDMQRGAKGFGDAWQSTLNQLTTKFDRVKASLEAAFIGLGHMLEPVAAKIMDFFNNAFAWADKHKQTIQKIGEWIKTFLVGAFLIAGGALAYMAAEAAIALAPFILLSLAAGALVKWLIGLYEHNAKFRAEVQHLAKVVQDDAVKAFRFLSDTFEKVKPTVERLTKIVGDDAPKAFKFLSEAFDRTKKVVGEVITAIVGFYEKHKTQIHKMLDDVGVVLSEIGDVFSAAFDAVKAIVQTVVKIVMDLWDRFGEHLWQHVVTTWNNIMRVIRGALEIIKGLFELVTGILTGHWSKAWQGIKDIVKGVWDVIGGVVSQAINEVSYIIGAAMAGISAVWDFAWHAMETLVKNIWNGIKDVATDVMNWFLTLGNRIIQAVGKAVGWLWNTGRDIIVGLWNGIVAVVDSVWNWFANIGGTVVGWFAQAGTWLYNAGRAIFTGLWNGIKSVWNDMTGWIGSIGGWISDHKGPIDKDRQLLVPHGKAIMAGLNEGLTTGFGSVTANLSGMASKLAGGMNVGITGTMNGSVAGVARAASLLGGSGAVGAGSGGTNLTVVVQGSVIDNNGLFKAVQTAVQQHGGRNPTAGLVFSR
jgi:TP901 family phage tail tape measure protein